MFSVSKLRKKGILICGLRGSGKTTLAKYIAQHFRTVVFAENPSEWYNMPDNVCIIEWEDFSNEELEFWIEKVEEWSREGKIECFIVDGIDLIFGHHLEKVEKGLRRLWIKMRHLGLTVILITRRPQDVPSRIWNSSDFIFMFHYEIPALIKMLDNIELGLGEKVKQLEKHEFILKDMSGEIPTQKYKLEKEEIEGWCEL